MQHTEVGRSPSSASLMSLEEQNSDTDKHTRTAFEVQPELMVRPGSYQKLESSKAQAPSQPSEAAKVVQDPLRSQPLELEDNTDSPAVEGSHFVVLSYSPRKLT